MRGNISASTGCGDHLLYARIKDELPHIRPGRAIEEEVASEPL
jgi:hypothetical protein